MDWHRLLKDLAWGLLLVGALLGAVIAAGVGLAAWWIYS